MSRMRTAIRIRPARSIWVPPTSTVLPWPILSSIAAASQGVAMSRLIGPAPSRHHSAPKQPTKMTIRAPTTTASRFSQRPPASQRRNGEKPVTERWKPRIGTRQQPARPIARLLFLILIPIGVVPFRLLVVGRRADRIPIVILGRRIPCHCLSIQAPVMGLSAAGAAAVDRKRTLPAPALLPYLEYSFCSSFRPGSAFNEQWGGAWNSL